MTFSKKFCTPQVAVWVSLALAVLLALLNSHLVYFIDSDEGSSVASAVPFTMQTNNTTATHICDTNKTNYLLFSETVSAFSVDDSLSGAIPVNPYVYQKCLIRQNNPSYVYFFKHIFPWIDTSLQVIFSFFYV